MAPVDVPDMGAGNMDPEDVGAGSKDVGLGDMGPEDVGPWDVGPWDVGAGDVGLGTESPWDVGPWDVGRGTEDAAAGCDRGGAMLPTCAIYQTFCAICNLIITAYRTTNAPTLFIRRSPLLSKPLNMRKGRLTMYTSLPFEDFRSVTSWIGGCSTPSISTMSCVLNCKHQEQVGLDDDGSLSSKTGVIAYGTNLLTGYLAPFPNTARRSALDTLLLALRTLSRGRRDEAMVSNGSVAACNGC